MVQASVENNSRQATNVAAGQTPAGYLPASPWSRQISYEQAAAPVVEPLGPSRVLKQPVRNSSAIQTSPKPAGLRWGSIRAIQPHEEQPDSRRESAEWVDLAEVPHDKVALEKANQQETKTLEIGSPMGREPLRVESGKSSPESSPMESIPVAAEDSESEGIFLLPAGPKERRSDSRSVGQFASSRESMTRSKPVVVPVDPEDEPASMVSSLSSQEAERMRIAQMQSHELLSIPLGPAYGEPRLLESPVGWKAVRLELAKHIESCDSLLKRGATYSARSEILVGLRKLFRTMDLHRGITHSETCFESALTAMREESDFHNLQMSRSVASVVAMHATPALKNRPLDSVTTELACQHYRAYARYQMAQAADGHLYAADLLYALGKTLEKDAEQNSDRAQQLRSQAVICYQTALQLRPNQHHASNQLGYALIHLDRIEEAYDALRSSIEAKPNAPAWTNLAEIYRRRGAINEADYAVRQATALGGDQPAEKLDITQVDPAVFAKFSPAFNASANSSASPPTLPASASSPAQPQTAKSASFFSKMFR